MPSTVISGVLLNALPAGAASDTAIIIIAGDEMLRPCKTSTGSPHDPGAVHGDIAQVPNLVGRLDHRIPTLDHLTIHLIHRCERAAVETTASGMPEVIIAGIGCVEAGTLLRWSQKHTTIRARVTYRSRNSRYTVRLVRLRRSRTQ